MSPRRTPKHSPEQEALDLGLFGAEPATPAESAGIVVPAETAESAKPAAPVEPQKKERRAALLSDEQLRTTAELTVRDLAAFARGEVSREELSERAAHRTSAPYRKALKALKHSLGPAAHTMTDDALYELVDIALAARQAAQPDVKQAEAPVQKKTVQKEPAQNEPSPQENETPVRATSPRPQKAAKVREEGEQKPAQKKSATRKTAAKKTTPVQEAAAQKTTAQKTTAQKTPAKKASTKKAAAASASAAAEAKSRALARYAAEDSLENAPLKKYLPAPSAKAIATHLGLETVGQMLEYFPRKYLPRGELSSFAELVEGQDVTIIARVVHVSTRTMAARRGKITEVTITDRLADSSAHEESGLGGIGPVSVTLGRTNASAPNPSSRAVSGLGMRWQATGQYNPRIDSLAAPASYTGYADSYGQDSFAQGGLFGVPAPAPLIGAQMKLSFFNAWTAAREIREGETMMFSGKVGIYRGEYTLTNPHYALLSKDASGSEMNEAATAPVPVYRAPVKLPTDRIAGYMEQHDSSRPQGTIPGMDLPRPAHPRHRGHVACCPGADALSRGIRAAERARSPAFGACRAPDPAAPRRGGRTCRSAASGSALRADRGTAEGGC